MASLAGPSLPISDILALEMRLLYWWTLPHAEVRFPPPSFEAEFLTAEIKWKLASP